MTHMRIHVPVALMLLVVTMLAPATSSAQLSATLYTEYASVEVGDETETVSGTSTTDPEDISASILGGAADITFEALTSPDWMRARANVGTTGAPARAEATGTINFSFRLSPIMNPPVPIFSVPMTVAVSGNASGEHSGIDVSVAVRSAFAMAGSASGVLVEREAYVDLISTESAAAFGDVVAYNMTPTEFATVTMFAQVILIATSEPPTSMAGAGAAWIDPVFEVSDDLIPGTSTRYDEVFEIVFSSGWDDATGGLPISGSQSVGKLKAQYRD